MADANANILEYERILLGLQDKYWATFQNAIGSPASKKELGIIWRYAISELLRWTPEEAVKYLTTDVVKTMKLHTTFYAVDFSIKHNFIGNYRKLIQLAFPEEKIYDFNEETITEYKKVAKKDEWANDKTPYRYNKSFFLETDGIDRARVVMNYVITKYCGDMTPIELYELFSDKERSAAFCTAHHLETPASLLYADDMLEFFHDAYRYRSAYLYYNNEIKEYIKHNKTNEETDL